MKDTLHWKYWPALMLTISIIWPGAAAWAQENRLFFCTPAFEGESQDRDFAGCSQLTSAGESIGLIEGNKLKNSEPRLESFQFFQPAQSSSIGWRMHALLGQPFDGTLHILQQTGDTRFEFLTVELTGIQVQSIKQSIGPEARPVDEISFLPARVTWTYTPQADDGSALPTLVFSYDVQSGMSF